MPSKKTSKRSSRPPRRTAIVPRVVFQTAVAAAVVPVMAVAAMGCGQAQVPGDAGRDGGFSVAMVRDGGPDSGFSVLVGPDSGFSVAIPLDSGTDSGFFSVAAPLDGAFSVIVAPPDASS